MVSNLFFFQVVIGILLLVSCSQAAPVTNGLVVYYDGHLSGNSLVDLSGNSNNGYPKNVIQGKNQETDANYINLNGVNSRVDITNNAQTNVSSPISIEFIGSINAFSSYGSLVSKFKDEETTGWYLSCSRDAPYNQARFGVKLTNGPETSIESNVGLIAGQVYDIVVTYDNSTAHVYVNGEDSGSIIWGSPIERGNNNITFACKDEVNRLNFCNCSMYTFRLYNRALSAAEVKQNYENDLWRSRDNILTIKKQVYGDGGLPRYMGSYAIQQSGSSLNILDNDLNIYSSVGIPFFQNDGGSLTNCSLVGTTINGIKWRNCYAPRSSAILTYTGNNRSVQDTCLLSNDSFDLNHSVTYSGNTRTVQDGVTVSGGRKYEFYGDGLNIINGSNVKLYTDNAMFQYNMLYNSTGGVNYSYYQTRNTSVTRTSSLELPLTSPQLSPMPVPYGYLGALIFAEHADFTDHDSLRTVMYGTNDTKNPNYGKKGFIGHNLTATWSVFAVSSASGEGLDSPALKSITDNMSNHGFEIVPHSFSGIVDDDVPNRADAETYLPWYVKNYSCRNWIDHGLSMGSRNTGLKSLGWDPMSTYYIMDLFQNYSIPYAWSFVDARQGEGINIVKNKSVGLPVDIVWQNTNLAFPDGASLYQWKSYCTNSKEALTYYNNNTINSMLLNYGVSIWHDYWPDNSTGNQDFTDYYYVKGHPNMINSTFDSLLTNISEQKQAGKLWNPTVSQYIDYWIAARNVEVRCTGVNTYTFVNHNPHTVNGFSMRVTGLYTPKLDGMTLSSKTNGGSTIFWTNLSTGIHTITLEA